MIRDLETLPRLAWWLLPHPMWPPGIGYFGFFVDCPHGHQNFVSGDFDQVRIVGAGGKNIATECHVCHVVFDMAPGQDVEVSTVGGRLTVRQIVTAIKDLRTAVAEATPSEVARLAEVLRGERPASDLERAPGPIGQWAAQHPHLMATLVGTLSGVIATLLAMWAAPRLGLGEPTTVIEEQVNVTVVIDHDPDDRELEQIIREATRGTSDVVDDTKPRPEDGQRVPSSR